MNRELETLRFESATLLENLFQEYAGPNFAIRLWDGLQWIFSAKSRPESTIVFENAAALEALLVHPNEISLGEAFIEGYLKVEGDLFSAFDVVEHVLHRPADLQRQFIQSLAKLVSEIRLCFREGSRHSLRRDRASIAHHYDQPVAFYRPWLGKTLVYSCAYFQSGDESLDQAQENKLELICKKLRLQPLERFLDIGCGWGGLILHAASRHGVYAHGITLSQSQAGTASQRIADESLTQSCMAELRDYRDTGDLLPFEKIASVGMVEHVGHKNLPQYFDAAYRLLKPGGIFLNHGIARSALSPPSKLSFIDKFVFPDGELVTLSQATQAAEKAGFEVRDVENLREHYEKTLRLWVRGLEEHADSILQHVSQTTYRIWLLYMAGSAAAFRRGDIAIYQTLLSRPMNGASHLPLTRHDWY